MLMIRACLAAFLFFFVSVCAGAADTPTKKEVREPLALQDVVQVIRLDLCRYALDGDCNFDHRWITKRDFNQDGISEYVLEATGSNWSGSGGSTMRIYKVHDVGGVLYLDRIFDGIGYLIDPLLSGGHHTNDKMPLALLSMMRVGLCDRAVQTYEYDGQTYQLVQTVLVADLQAYCAESGPNASSPTRPRDLISLTAQRSTLIR